MIAAFRGGVPPDPRLAAAELLRRKQAKRNKGLRNQPPDMLSMLVGSLRRLRLQHAISVVKDEMPAPLAPEFGRAARTALGFSIGDVDHLVSPNMTWP